MKTRTCSLQKAISLIRATNGKVFRATFIKRTTGQLRKMVGRTNVTKGVTGKGMAYDPFDRGLLPIYDFQKQEFRMINLETLQEISVKRTLWKIK